MTRAAKRTRQPSPSAARKAAARAALAEARAEEKRVKATRKIEASELRATCKARRVELKESRKRNGAAMRDARRAAIEELRASWDRRIADYKRDAANARAMLSGACKPDKTRARAELVALRGVIARAGNERAAAIAAARKAKVRGPSIADRQAHAIWEAQAEFRHDWERDLLEQLVLRRQIKAKPRASLAEVFNEWMAENTAQTMEYRNAYDEAAVEAMVRSEDTRYQPTAANFAAARASDWDFGG
jgi:hypothetical protein